MESSEPMDTNAQRDSAQDNAIASQLILFAGKTLIVATVFIVSVLIIAVHIENKVSQFAQEVQKSARDMTKVGGPDFWGKLDKEIDRAADPAQAVSAERKQKILSDLRVITAQWKPFLTEAYSIVAESPSEPAVGAPPGK
jgi:hypothetical protein